MAKKLRYQVTLTVEEDHNKITFKWPDSKCGRERTRTWHYVEASESFAHITEFWCYYLMVRGVRYATSTPDESSKEQAELSPGSSDPAEEQAGSATDEGRLPALNGGQR